MTAIKNQKRILALDVRPRSFGYVVFEGSNQLLECGVKGFPNGVNAVQVPRSRKLEPLMEEFRPSGVVLREPGLRRNRKRFINSVREKAAGRRVGVRLLSPRAIQKAFGSQKCMARYELASALAERFPELAWLLPPKRKCWQSEDYRMSIFDAAAIGVAYFTRRENHSRPVPARDAMPP